MAKKANEEQDTFDEVVKAIDANEVEPDKHLSIDIDQSLRDAICAAQLTGKPSSVTITIKVKKNNRRLQFAANVKATLPRVPTPVVELYADAEGNVSNRDPAQGRFTFNEQSEFKPKEEI